MFEFGDAGHDSRVGVEEGGAGLLGGFELPCFAFARLALFRIADLEAAGFEVVPTFRTPHVTIAFTGDVVARLRRLAGEELELRSNPYHEGNPTLAGPNEEDR